MCIEKEKSQEARYTKKICLETFLLVWKAQYYCLQNQKMYALQDVGGMENLRLYDVFLTAFDSQSQLRKQLISFVVVVTSFEWKAVFSAYSE